jgi:hypothetical protein
LENFSQAIESKEAILSDKVLSEQLVKGIVLLDAGEALKLLQCKGVLCAESKRCRRLFLSGGCHG